LFERAVLRRADHFFVLTKMKEDFLASQLGIDRSKITNRGSGAGVDFDLFRPQDKSRAKKELGLGVDKPVLLYVGRTIREKGLPLIIEFWKRLRQERDVELVVAGARPGSELYEVVKKEVKFTFDWAYDAVERLPTCYNAASVFMQFWEDSVLAVAGVGTASVEALACNTPVVSNSLTNAPSEIRSSLGAIPHRPGDLLSCFERALEMAPQFNGREIAKRYWSWDAMIQMFVSVYNEVSERKPRILSSQ
jgi:D-inositol-3-phosphate glycosyltransferase